MSIYKLQGTISGGTENSLAQLDVQFDGTIVAISASIHAELDADNDVGEAEVSFLSTNTLSSNSSAASPAMWRRSWVEHAPSSNESSLSRRFATPRTSCAAIRHKSAPG